MLTLNLMPKKFRILVVGGMLAALAGFTVPALALGPGSQNENVPAQTDQANLEPSAVVPGMLNYVQGSATIQGKALTAKSAGSTILKPGEVLSTEQGKVEMLLTPGVYFRLGDDSAVKMVSPELTWTALDLEKGKAIVEVNQISPENNIQIYHGGVGTQLLKNGIYKFNAATSTVEVFKGEAAVRKPEDHWVVVKSNHEYPLHAELGVKPQKFDPAAAQGDLYAWSNLRSQYLGRASQELAARYGAGYYPGYGYGPGWYPYGGLGYGYFGGSLWRPFGWGWGGYYPPPFFGGGIFFPAR